MNPLGCRENPLEIEELLPKNAPKSVSPHIGIFDVRIGLSERHQQPTLLVFSLDNPKH
jgi:hypothetical protein